VIIDLKEAPINLTDLPAGFTAQDALEVRTLVIRLRAAGLHVLFTVANDAQGFQFASRDSRVLSSMAADGAAQLAQVGQPIGQA